MRDTERDKIEFWQDSLEPFIGEIEKCKRKLQEDVFLLLIYTASYIATSVQRYFDSTEIRKIANRKDIRVLQVLIMHGGRAKPTQISRDILQSKYAITRVVDSLEIRGLVKREPFGEDLRTRDIVITKKGVEVTDQCIDYVQSFIMPKVLQNLSHEQKANLQLLLKKINHYLLSTNTNNSEITK